MGEWRITLGCSTSGVGDLWYLYSGNVWHHLKCLTSVKKVRSWESLCWGRRGGVSGTSFIIDLLSSVFTFLRPLTMPHQGLLLFRMAPLCVLLSMLMVSCFNFCLCHKNSVSIFTQVEGSLGSKKVSMPPGLLWEFLSFLYLFIFLFYNIVLVLPYIDMNLPWEFLIGMWPVLGHRMCALLPLSLSPQASV